jgi:nucleotide-binding universal stress UspA family protein
MRSILVLADRSPVSEKRLQAALSLARANSGHLTVLIDTPVARYLMTDAMGSGYLAADIVREAVDSDNAFAETLNKRLLHEDVPYDILRAEDEPTDAIAEAARLNDVVVLSRGQPFVSDGCCAGRLRCWCCRVMGQVCCCRPRWCVSPGMAAMRRPLRCGWRCHCWCRPSGCMC